MIIIKQCTIENVIQSVTSQFDIFNDTKNISTFQTCKRNQDNLICNICAKK